MRFPNPMDPRVKRRAWESAEQARGSLSLRSWQLPCRRNSRIKYSDTAVQTRFSACISGDTYLQSDKDKFVPVLIISQFQLDVNLPTFSTSQSPFFLLLDASRDGVGMVYQHRRHGLLRRIIFGRRISSVDGQIA